MSHWKARQKSNGNWEISEEPDFPDLSTILVALAAMFGVFICFVLLFKLMAFTDNSASKEIEAKKQAEIDAQMAVEASIWDLGIEDYNHMVSTYGEKRYAYDGQDNKYADKFEYIFANGNEEGYFVIDVNDRHTYTRFTTTIFALTEKDEKVIFRIYADGSCIYDSGIIDSSTPAKDISLNITGVDKLKFSAVNANSDPSWNYPKVYLIGSKVYAE